MRLIDAEHLKWNVGGIKCGTLTVAYLNWILEHEEPTVDAIPIQYILNTIREWNRYGYAESAEALEILVTNWDKENTEWAKRKEE